MLTRTFRSARGSFSSSALLALGLLVAVAAPASAAEDGDLAVRLQLSELETELARNPTLYLVLDPAHLRLEVRARGLALRAIPLTEVVLLTFNPMIGSGEQPQELVAPAVWTITEGPGDGDRETIAPTTLRPYSEEEQMEEPAAAAPDKQPGEGEKPTSYRMKLDNGWQLFVVDEAPRLGWWRRFAASVRSGWQRLKGVQPAHPPLVTLVVSSEDARALHQLFRTGTPILVRSSG